MRGSLAGPPGQGPVFSGRARLPALRCPSHQQRPAPAEQTCPDLLDPTSLHGSPCPHLSRAHWKVPLGSMGPGREDTGPSIPRHHPASRAESPGWVQAPVSAEAAGWASPPPPCRWLVITNLCTEPRPSPRASKWLNREVAAARVNHAA